MKTTTKAQCTHAAIISNALYECIAIDSSMSCNDAHEIIHKELSSLRWVDDFIVELTANLILENAYFEFEFGNVFQLRCPEMEDAGGIMGEIIKSFER